MTIHIETQRLIMRDIEPEDAQGIFALDSDPEVHRYLGNNPIKTLDQACDIISHIRRQYIENGIGRWAVIEKESGLFVGWSGLKLEQEVRVGVSYHDIGYRLRKEFWGKGFATETAIESIRYGFEQLGYPQISAAAHVDNLGSNRVLQKAGLVVEETSELDGDLHHWYTIRNPHQQ